MFCNPGLSFISFKGVEDCERGRVDRFWFRIKTFILILEFCAVHETGKLENC